jgi:hypothetical protein
VAFRTCPTPKARGNARSSLPQPVEALRDNRSRDWNESAARVMGPRSRSCTAASTRL